MANTKAQNGKPSSRVILFAIILIVIIAAGIYLYAGWIGYQEAPKIIEVQDPADPIRDLYTLSLEQESALDSSGHPEAFTILFYEEETPDQEIQTVRLETWEYYSLGMGLIFINGELASEYPLEWDNQAIVIPSPYYPEQFGAFMSLDNILGNGEIETYIEVPLNKDLMDKGVLYYADSLSFGLQDNQLVYIEALALFE